MTRAMKRQLEDELDLDENFRPTAPRIAPPVTPAAGNPADSTHDYDPDAETDAVTEAEAYIPQDDDTYSPLHDEESDDEQEKSA